jgi:hypothetical protein
VLEALEARGLAVTQAQRLTITDRTDPAMLLAWLQRAATASDAAELLVG